MVERLEKRVLVILLLGLTLLGGLGLAATNGFLQSNSSDLVAHYTLDEGRTDTCQLTFFPEK
ncbi:MAG: hypothetical protein SVS85_03065, partial [Candidatus Nanohaloarchaea archaeon]|nr:hypothetical protein [Candidatus Nanohaloarchaea archaeon]